MYCPSSMTRARNTHDRDETLQALRDDRSHKVHIPHALVPANLGVLENVQGVLPVPGSASPRHGSEVVVDIRVHHVDSLVDVVLDKELAGMGEGLSNVGVVGEDLVVGVDSDVPVRRSTLIVTGEDRLEIHYSILVRDLGSSQPGFSIVVSRVGSCCKGAQ